MHARSNPKSVPGASIVPGGRDDGFDPILTLRPASHRVKSRSGRPVAFTNKRLSRAKLDPTEGEARGETLLEVAIE